MFGFKINPEKIKKKNTKLLRKRGIDVVEHLPWIEIAKQRSDVEIARRCIVLASLLQLHFGAPKELIGKYLKDNNLLDSVTPEENKLLEVDLEELEEQEKIDLYWVIEAVWALAWVGEKHDNLTLNTGVESSLAGMLPNFHEEQPAESFITSFCSRKQVDVFEKLDMFYRAHWFARNNELSGKESSLVDLSIIMERRKALEWVSDSHEQWDDISLHT